MTKYKKRTQIQVLYRPSIERPNHGKLVTASLVSKHLNRYKDQLVFSLVQRYYHSMCLFNVTPRSFTAVWTGRVNGVFTGYYLLITPKQLTCRHTKYDKSSNIKTTTLKNTKKTIQQMQQMSSTKTKIPSYLTDKCHIWPQLTEYRVGRVRK